jgi:hypothetical protein
LERDPERPPPERDALARLPPDRDALARLPPDRDALARLPPEPDELFRLPPDRDALARLPPEPDELFRLPADRDELERDEELRERDALARERDEELPDPPFDELRELLEERRELELRRRRVDPPLRSAAGISSRATAFASCSIWRARNFAIRSSSRRMLRAIFAVSLSPTVSASDSIPV